MLNIHKNEALIDLTAYQPVKFWPYTSVVTRYIVKISYASGDPIERMANELIQLFNDSGVPAKFDNKIVFELRDHTGQTIFIGFKDWVLTVGLGMNSDHKSRDTQTDAKNSLT